MLKAEFSSVLILLEELTSYKSVLCVYSLYSSHLHLMRLTDAGPTHLIIHKLLMGEYI